LIESRIPCRTDRGSNRKVEADDLRYLDDLHCDHQPLEHFPSKRNSSFSRNSRMKHPLWTMWSVRPLAYLLGKGHGVLRCSCNGCRSAKLRAPVGTTISKRNLQPSPGPCRLRTSWRSPAHSEGRNSADLHGPSTPMEGPQEERDLPGIFRVYSLPIPLPRLSGDTQYYRISDSLRDIRIHQAKQRSHLHATIRQCQSTNLHPLFAPRCWIYGEHCETASSGRN